MEVAAYGNVKLYARVELSAKRVSARRTPTIVVLTGMRFRKI